MHRNIRLLITFDGTAYNGWQRQPHAPTIQATLENKLHLLCGEPVKVHGAGRTDSGVHALGMVAHFQTTVAHPLSAFTKGLNSMLPADIRILEASEVPVDFHSRYSALAKTYRYDFFTGRLMLPTDRLYQAHFPCTFNLDAVKKCLQHLIGRHDFSSFEASGSRDRTQKKGRGAIRTIFQADCIQKNSESERWSFVITGDGFLRHMVRNLVGTLWLAGEGKLSPAAFNDILQARNRCSAGPTAPACGLFLVHINYDGLAKKSKRGLHNT